VVGTAPEALYTAFNEADLLVADISSVVTDFLASRKPYLVTNPRDTDAATFHADFPSTAAGALIRPDVEGLAQSVRDAFGEDSFRDRRERLATYFLGDPVGDPIAHFVEEVERAVERTTPRIAHVPQIREPIPHATEETGR
jgi:CDP-glycerol glycerophosphotransferase (TagB/SpsB family)